MVNLKRVQAKEYSRCRAKDFWMDAGSLASWAAEAQRLRRDLRQDKAVEK